MISKTVIALGTVLVLGTLGTAYAGSDRDSGGYDIGPLGQCFAPPDCGQARNQRGYYGYAYVPDRRQHPHVWHRSAR
jgi:hypothetical protein